MATERRILALDPATKATGYAVGGWTGSVLEAGVIRGRSRDNACDRVRTMTRELQQIIAALGPFYAVGIEVPAKKPPGRIKAAANQATYGYAVGAIAATTWLALPRTPIYQPRSDQWKNIPKPQHVQRVAIMVPSYRPEHDAGGDIADAIGIMWWTIRAIREGRSRGARARQRNLV